MSKLTKWGPIWVGIVLPWASAGANDALKCESANQTLGDIQVQRAVFSDGTCDVSVSPQEDFSLTYRNYLFNDQGLLMVFNSVPGEEATSTGARSYFFYPRKGKLAYEFLPDGRLQVITDAGLVFYFSSKTARVDSIPGASFAEDPVVSMKNNGGLQILKAGGVWLDTGWQTGSASYQDPSRHSVFHDSLGTLCDVVNSEIFKNSSRGNPIFKFATDESLGEFLKARCPALLTTSLFY